MCPTGAYNVYVWTFEPNGPLSLILSLEQNVASNFTTGAAGSWLRLGPFPINVDDGNAQIRLQTTVPNSGALLSGVELWQNTAPLPTPTGTFYRAINGAGPQ